MNARPGDDRDRFEAERKVLEDALCPAPEHRLDQDRKKESRHYKFTGSFSHSAAFAAALAAAKIARLSPLSTLSQLPR